MTAIDLRTNSLVQQGYDYGPSDLKQLSWALRFTPSLCMALALVGLVTQQPVIHFALAVLGMGGLWIPAWHPFDLLYNHVLRRLWNGVPVPPNPLPRRIACFMGGLMNLGIGIAFTLGSPIAAYVLGVVLIALQVIVITTHFCVASWLYEGALRLTGRWSAPIDPARAKALVASGARLIDVRSPTEFAAGHLEGAVNVPVEQLPRELATQREQGVVLYCRSGLRSQQATQVLRRLGHDQAFNLGAMSRWLG